MYKRSQVTMLSLSHEVSFHCHTVSASVKVHYCVWTRRQRRTQKVSLPPVFVLLLLESLCGRQQCQRDKEPSTVELSSWCVEVSRGGYMWVHSSAKVHTVGLKWHTWQLRIQRADSGSRSRAKASAGAPVSSMYMVCACMCTHICWPESIGVWKWWLG